MSYSFIGGQRVGLLCVRLLREHGPLATDQLLFMVNKGTKDGTTSVILGNILGKNRSIFARVGVERICPRSASWGTYPVYIWDLVERCTVEGK